MIESTAPSRTATMLAVVRDNYGAPEVLHLQERSAPEPAADQVLVRVRAASVGAWDWHDLHGDPWVMRLAGMGLRTPRKTILGLDLAGEVVAVGKDVVAFEPGDVVYGEGTGTFAEFAVAGERHLAHAPSSIGVVEAAAVPVAGATALLGLREYGGVEAGDSVVIVGAAGGVGSFAVQIARSMGADVTAVCSDRSAELVRSLGADRVIDYAEADFTELGDRFDVVFQIAGAASARACCRALKRKGRLVLCSGDGGGRLLGPIPRIAAGVVVSPFVSQSVRTYVAEVSTDILDDLTALIDRGELTPVLDTTYPLCEAAAAMRHFEEGHGPGKIVLTV